MDNQHKKIKGYRDLSQAEVDLMNEIKEKAEDVGLLVERVSKLREIQLAKYLNKDAPNLGIDKINEAIRCVSISKPELQTGFMWLVRAVALPDSF
jgi:hypothetical protein